MNVVYIDDEPMICRIVAIGLHNRGIEVTTFTDPHKAIEFIQSTNVTVVFSDYRMPQMRGSELLETVDDSTAFYLVTGDASVFDDPVVRAHDCRILPKPFDLDEMAELVEAAAG